MADWESGIVYPDKGMADRAKALFEDNDLTCRIVETSKGWRVDTKDEVEYKHDGKGGWWIVEVEFTDGWHSVNDSPSSKRVADMDVKDLKKRGKSARSKKVTKSYKP